MFGFFKRDQVVDIFGGETRGGWWTVYARYSSGKVGPFFGPFGYMAGRSEALRRARAMKRNVLGEGR